jgi:hypothetical protein
VLHHANVNDVTRLYVVTLSEAASLLEVVASVGA